MRVVEGAIAGTITAVILMVLAHHHHLSVDLLTVGGVSFLVMFIAVVVRPGSAVFTRERGRR